MTKKGLQNSPLFLKKGQGIFFIPLIIKANISRLIMCPDKFWFDKSKY